MSNSKKLTIPFKKSWIRRVVGLATPVLIAGFTMCLTMGTAYACTTLQLIASDGTPVVGRTMEFGFDLQSDVLVVPAGSQLQSSLDKGMTYTTKYGMVGANGLHKPIITDGVNEKGLYVGVLYLPGYAEYAEPIAGQSDHELSPLGYGAWLLGNFATVEQVMAGYDKVRLVPHPIKELGNETPPLHFIVHDSTGASVVIEPVGGKLKIYRDPVGVLTNSPTFDWHVTNLSNYVNLSPLNIPQVNLKGLRLSQFGQGSGLLGIPGDYTPPSRFVRAVVFSLFAEKLPTAKETVPQVFHLMNAFDIPKGAVREDSKGKEQHDYTVWTTVSDLKNIRWDFRTHKDQTIRSVDVRKALQAADGKIRVIKMGLPSQPIEDVSTHFVSKDEVID